jgi:heme exporter protein B
LNKFWAKVFIILWKDILAELRTKDTLASLFVFALLVVVIFNFALAPESKNSAVVAPGIIWAAFTFAGILALNRTFVLEKDRGCLGGLMLCPVPREVIYAGKMLGTFVFMLIVEAIILPIFCLLMDVPLSVIPQLGLVTVLATIGFVAVGTLFSAMAVNTKAREVLLPLLFLPMVIPVIIAAVESSTAILSTAPHSSPWGWIGMIVAFDAIFLVISAFAFEFVLES